jgi:peptide/nickel transport system ATP-binding protein
MIDEAKNAEGVTCVHVPPVTPSAHCSGAPAAAPEEVLRVENLSVAFRMYDEKTPLDQADFATIHNVSLSVAAGEIVAVVGASGSGKTLLADSILGMFEPNATVTGNIYFEGALQNAQSLAALRGHGISLMPQSVDSLDPLMRVGRQVRGVVSQNAEGVTSKRQTKVARTAKQRALFERYGLPAQVERMYPHELSGGMARRVLLCCALMDDPRLIVADEPTPGLDLPLAVQALGDLREFANAGGAVLLITHDIELALQVADRVAVFKAGTVCEEMPAAQFASGQGLRDPFTRALWDAMPEHSLKENMEMEKLV